MIRSIVAIDQQRGLAKRGFQPWFIPDDEKYFTDETKKFGGIVLYGKRTFELSMLGKPLAERQNYIVTHDTTPIPGAYVVNDLNKFFEEHHRQDVWVVGGAQIFEQTMAIADELYITKIKADFGCDQLFPKYEAAFELAEASDMHTENGFLYTYTIYKRKPV